MLFAHSPDPNSDQSGFTLLEMLVVVLMVVVLAAIAAPSWLGFMNNQRVSNSRNQILLALRQAQSTARSTNRIQYVYFDTPTGGVPRIAVSPASTQVTVSAADWQTLGNVGNGNVQSGMIALSFTGASSPIVFDNDGTFCLNKSYCSAQTSFPTNGININVQVPNLNSSRRCVVITTLLGAMREERGIANCP